MYAYCIAKFYLNTHLFVNDNSDSSFRYIKYNACPSLVMLEWHTLNNKSEIQLSAVEIKI